MESYKRAGVEFAIIRSSYGHFVEDQQFRRNVKECERYKIPYGLYHYSYVANHAQMKEEAEGFYDSVVPVSQRILVLLIWKMLMVGKPDMV